MKRPIVIAMLLLLMSVSAPRWAYSCSWAVGYFHQVTKLNGTVVGTNRAWPRWFRQRVVRERVTMSLYEYRWRRSRSDMPLVKTVKTDDSGQFDFGEVKKGHYTLVIDWPSESANWFDVEVTTLANETASITIDVSPVSPDCTGGHEFIVR